MRIHSILTLLTFVYATHLFASDVDFSYKTIPAAMLPNANAVVRESSTEINIVSGSEIYETKHYAVTVLNEEGSKYGVINEYYNKQKSVQSIEGTLYDAQGKELAEVKKSAIKDIGLTRESFFDDYRAKVFEFHYATYPYTCVYDIVTVSNSSLFFPIWQPQFNYDCAVEKSEVIVHYPKAMPLRYRAFCLKAPLSSIENDQKTLTIDLQNLAATGKPSEFAPSGNFHEPTLVMATDSMTLLGFDGSMATWKDLGAFVYKLNAGRDTLPEKTSVIVHKLTDSCTSSGSKINILYEYLKQNTRYVNIMLGIGGWQTLEAKSVATLGYGDCKALSNYMKSLLKEAGITSYQVLVYGGVNEDGKLQTDFPLSMFNHVILCVPGTHDTTWLECTAKDLPAGYLSSFTSNRNVLLLTPSGGYLMRTPAYNEVTNTLTRVARLSIDDNEQLKGVVNALYMGYWWDSEHYYANEAKSLRDEYFNKKLALSNYTASAYKINKADKNNIPGINEEIPISGTGVLSKMGDKIFVSPRVFNLSVASATSVDDVKDSFQLHQDYQVFDTTIISLNGSYEPEKLAPDINADYPFASYHTHTFFENGNLLKIAVYYRQKEGVYPSSFFKDYKKMSRQVNTNTAYSTVVLHKIK